MKKIITHNGSAHRDEVLALAIVLASKNIEIRPGLVERRCPTPEEFEDNQVLILDTGERYEPKKLNFDHHQRKKNKKPECTLSLVAKWLGIENLLADFDWFWFSKVMDVFGPKRTAEIFGWEKFPFETLSPIEREIFHWFETGEDMETLLHVLKKIGGGIIQDSKDISANKERLRDMAIVKEVKGLKILILQTDNTKGANDIKDELCPDAAISIQYDDRDRGWCLYRYDDHPRVDFSKIKKNPRVEFAHATGHIAKTKDRIAMDDVIELCADSITGR